MNSQIHTRHTLTSCCCSSLTSVHVFDFMLQVTWTFVWLNALSVLALSLLLVVILCVLDCYYNSRKLGWISGSANITYNIDSSSTKSQNLKIFVYNKRIGKLSSGCEISLKIIIWIEEAGNISQILIRHRTVLYVRLCPVYSTPFSSQILLLITCSTFPCLLFS